MTAQDRTRTIAKHHKALLAGRLRFATRLKEVKRYRGKIGQRFEKISALYDVEEERFAVIDAIEDFESGLRHQIAFVDRELARLQKGLASLALTKGGVMKKSFEEYIIDDLTQTLTHITMTCYEYDLIMDSVREIERTT